MIVLNRHCHVRFTVSVVHTVHGPVQLCCWLRLYSASLLLEVGTSITLTEFHTTDIQDSGVQHTRFLISFAFRSPALGIPASGILDPSFGIPGPTLDNYF